MAHRSLRAEIFVRLIAPLIFFVSLETILSYYVTLHYTDVTYDRWLLDSARSLLQEIKVKDNKIVAELPPAALEIFKWDEWDQTYFKVIGEKSGLIAGDSIVPEPGTGTANESEPYFFSDRIYDKPVRVVSMLWQRENVPEKVFIHVAETLNKRQSMMQDILLADLIPQMLLVMLSAYYLKTAVNRVLKPVHELSEAIAQRSPKDLSPISETYVFAEVRSLTDTINLLLARIADAISQQQRFIANAAHQLRTPLAGLKLQAERAERENDFGKMKPALQQIQNSADRASRMISQLLALAKSEPIEGGYELAPVKLCQIVRETCMEWVPKALARQIELSFESDCDEQLIQGDSVLIKELVANLLANAIAYGRNQGNIWVQIKQGSDLKLMIADDGRGIETQEQGRIFERFYRTPGSPGDGCGLGLSIVKEIADLHQAQLSIFSAGLNFGTRIEITFKCL